MIDINSKAPDFTLPTDSNGSVSLKDFLGQPVVLYFYPKDDTPGCTTESCDFNNNLAAFNSLKTPIIGISKCSVKSHDAFKEKYGLCFTLASDEAGDVCERYGVWKEKSMYGKTYMGIERSTFLIDKDGKIAGVWRNVKVDGHVNEVLQAVQKI